MPYILCCTYLKHNSTDITWSEEWLEEQDGVYGNNVKLRHMWIFAFWTLVRQAVIPFNPLWWHLLLLFAILCIYFRMLLVLLGFYIVEFYLSYITSYLFPVKVFCNCWFNYIIYINGRHIYKLSTYKVFSLQFLQAE
jgi:hypothetical protein